MHEEIMRRTAVLGLIALLAILLWRAPAQADRVYTVDDRVHEGKVIFEDEDQVKLERKFGNITSVVTFRRDEVLRIEKAMTKEEEYQAALAAAETPEACMEAAEQAKAHRLHRRDIRKAYEKAIEIDPDFKPAREILGFKYLDGKWISEREWKLAKGYQWYRGELLEPAEIEKRKGEERDRIEGGYAEEIKGVGWGERHVVSTDHYEVHCNSTKRVAEGYAQFLEQLYDAYDSLFRGYPRYYQGKSKIYIFRNIEDFQTYGGARPGVGGYYRPKSDNPNAYPDRMVASYHGTFGTTGGTREVLAHECTHQFEHILSDGNEMQFLSRPPWWIEGLAVYFGDGYTFDNKGKLVIGIPRDRLMIIQRVLGSGKAPPISRFLRITLGEYQRNAGLTYPYGWSLCHYFLHRGKGKPVDINGKSVDLRKVFDDFFKVVTAEPPGGMGPQGFPEYYARKFEELLGFPVDELTKDWKDYVLSLELEPLGEIKKNTFSSDKLAFEITKPDGWEWREDEVQGQEAIRLENGGTTGRIVVVAQGNMELSSPEAALDQLESQAGMRVRSPTIDDTNIIEVYGFPAAEVYYSGFEMAQQNASREVAIRTNEQMFRHVMVVTLKRLYEIVMQCDVDRWDDNEEAFKEALRGFIPKADSE
jgi:hypothetical protein